MFMDKTKPKFAKIISCYTEWTNVTVISEIIFDKKTKKKIEEKGFGCYVGKKDVNKTWTHYYFHLSVVGKDPEIEYLTEEQYKSCWSEFADIDFDFFDDISNRAYLLYEQKHYKRN